MLHPTSLPERPARTRTRTRSSTGSPPPAQSWWQVLPLGPPDEVGSPYASSSAFAALARAARRAGGARRPTAEVGDVRARHGYWVGDWERTPAATPRRPGPLRARVDGAARLRARARRPPGRRRADLRRRGQRRPPSRTPSSSSTARRGRAAGRPRPAGPALGQPALRLGRARARAATAGGSSGCAAMLELVDVVPDRPLPRLRRVLGDPGDGRPTRAPASGCPGPGAGAVSRRRAELGPLPVIAEDLGLITPDVARAPRRARLPRHGGAALGVRAARREQPAPAREPPRAPGRLHLDARHRDARRRLPATATRGSWSSWRSSSRAALAMVPAQDVLGLGNEARMNTPGRDGGNWAWRLEPGELTAEHARTAARRRESTDGLERVSLRSCDVTTCRPRARRRRRPSRSGGRCRRRR